MVDTQDPGKPHGLKSTIWRRVKELFDLLDDDAALILFDPHRDLLAGLEREPIIAGHVRRDSDPFGHQAPRPAWWKQCECNASKVAPRHPAREDSIPHPHRCAIIDDLPGTR